MLAAEDHTSDSFQYKKQLIFIVTAKAVELALRNHYFRREIYLIGGSDGLETPKHALAGGENWMRRKGRSIPGSSPCDNMSFRHMMKYTESIFLNRKKQECNKTNKVYFFVCNICSDKGHSN